MCVFLFSFLIFVFLRGVGGRGIENGVPVTTVDLNLRCLPNWEFIALFFNTNRSLVKSRDATVMFII